jgi:hypothetical protein
MAGINEANMTQEKIPYFINLVDAPKLIQMAELETTILTGLHGEKILKSSNKDWPDLLE